VVTICTACCNGQKRYILPTECASIYVFHEIWKKTATISLNSINRFVILEWFVCSVTHTYISLKCISVVSDLGVCCGIVCDDTVLSCCSSTVKTEAAFCSYRLLWTFRTKRAIPKTSGIQLSCSRTPRCNFSSTLYPRSCWCIIQVIHSLHLKLIK
jgi:hypothetical protein